MCFSLQFKKVDFCYNFFLICWIKIQFHSPLLLPLLATVSVVFRFAQNSVWITGNSIVPFNFRYSWYDPTLSIFLLLFSHIVSHFALVGIVSSHSLLIFRMCLFDLYCIYDLAIVVYTFVCRCTDCEFYRLFHEISLWLSTSKLLLFSFANCSLLCAIFSLSLSHHYH